MKETGTVKRIWKLTTLCIRGPGGILALFYCLLILALGLFEVYLGLKLINWSRDFFGALEKMDGQAALWQIGVFLVITAFSSGRFIIARYFRQLVQIKWRTTLTRISLEKWFNNKAFWHLNSDSDSRLDNPDQRISEDCLLFVERMVGGGQNNPMGGYNVLDLFAGIVGLTTYFAMLWQLSDFPISFTLFGTELVIQHYLIWAAPIYVLISSLITHRVGRPLMRLNIIHQHREADMRFALARTRESREAIALENGENAEKDIIDTRYSRILENWKHRINREFMLGMFTRPYLMMVQRIPLFLAFPAYLMGHVALGGLMQLGSAFSRFVTTLSWFIFAYKDMAELGATANRLASFMEMADAAATEPPPIRPDASPDARLHVRDLIVNNPLGERLIHLPELVVNRGEAVWLDGPSGIGKSTLLKALAGIWPYCRGRVSLPKGKTLFLPQKPYLPLGSLAACVTYPDKPGDIKHVRQLLRQVGFTCPRHEEQLEKPELSSDYRLSGGEQQRLMFARILAAQPDWLFLDEATSSLDAEAEAALYHLLRTALPHTGIIIIAHREPEGLGQYRRISFREENPAPLLSSASSDTLPRLATA